jgi:type II secretory pathway predicted ATPase ExeA
MFEAYFGFNKNPFTENPHPQQIFESQGWTQMRSRLQFLLEHRGAGLLTGEVGAGKSTAARCFTSALNPNLYKILYVYWSAGSAMDLLRLLAFELNIQPYYRRADLVRQIAEAIVRLNQSKKQHPVLVIDEAQLLSHAALEQLPLLLNFEMDSSRQLSLLLLGQPLLRRTLSLQLHEPLRQRIGVHYHLEGLSRDELDAYLAHQLKASGIRQPLFDETARQALYQASKGIVRRVNNLARAALAIAASRKANTVDEDILLEASKETFS